jgi:lipoprotein-anchoring transpeptidase ErfK/SrfK
MGVSGFFWPNPLVPLKTRYRATQHRKSRFPWILVALSLATGVWFWRQKTDNTSLTQKGNRRGGATTSVPRSLGDSPVQAPVTSTQVKASFARTNRLPSEVAIPTPSEFGTGTSITSFVARPAQNVFEAQLALARIGISPGSLDGVPGQKTRLALIAFQLKERLPVTGALDASSRGHLVLFTPPFTNYTVTADDLARLRPLGKSWLEKSQQDRLDYETILELVAEKGQSHPNLIRELNPSVDWTNVVGGTFVTVPNVERPPVREKAALAKIHLEERLLQVFGESTNLLAHFPCSIAVFAEKRPVGKLHVAAVALNPNYTFDPDNFPESAEARELNRKLVLPPGPNNPVGTVWIGLDKPGYGIHGTPRPEQVGRAESHGCFRLANWNAEFFAQLVWVGMPVFVEP